MTFFTGYAAAFDAEGMPVGGLEPIFEFSPEEGFVTKPIDLGPEGQQVFLIIFGTGMRGAAGAVSATIDGELVAVNGPVPHAFLIGLDQANLGALSRTFIGRGEVDVILIVDGKPSNVVKFNIQ